MKANSRKYLWFGLSVWALVVTSLRALRLPNDYAKAHWLIDYRYGFIKRGIVGATFASFSKVTGIPQTEWSIACLSLIIFIIFCAVLLLIAMRIMAKNNWNQDAFLLASVFLTSPFIVMNAHLMGYFDHLFITLTFCSAFLVLRENYWKASFLQVIAVLIHESSVIVCLPCIVLTFLLKAETLESHKRNLKFFLPMVLPILVFAILFLYQSIGIEREHLGRLLTERLSSFNFIKSERASIVPKFLLTSFPEFLQSQKQLFIKRLTNHNLIIRIVPSLLTILYFLFRAFRIKIFSLQSLMIILTVITPLIMHLIAWDSPRIWTYLIFCSIFVTWIHFEIVLASPKETARSYFYLLVFPTLIFNIFNRMPLMDKAVEHFTSPERFFLYAPILIYTLAIIGISIARRIMLVSLPTIAKK